MKSVFFKKYVNFFNELLTEHSRLMIIDNYTWKFYRLISPYQIKYFPTLTSKLIGKGRLPFSIKKIAESADPCDDFLFRDLKKINKKDKQENVNIILKGLSTNSIKLIDKTLPTYIVNMNYKDVFNEFDHVIQITCDGGIFNGWLGNKKKRHGYKLSKNKIIFLIGDNLSNSEIKDKSSKKILEKLYLQYKIKNLSSFQKRLHFAAMNHKINISRNPMGTGLWAILYLLKRHHFLNIYGWDQYKPYPFKEMSMIQFIKDIWCTVDLVRSNEKNMKEGGTFNVPKQFFCGLLISYIYIYKILTSKTIKSRISVDGNVNNISILSNIILKLKKIIYK